MTNLKKKRIRKCERRKEPTDADYGCNFFVGMFDCLISVFKSACFNLELNAQCQEQCVFTIVSPEDRLQFGPTTLPSSSVTKYICSSFKYICSNCLLYLFELQNFICPNHKQIACWLDPGQRQDLALEQYHKI